MADIAKTWHCAKCGVRLPAQVEAPAYCAKCELVNALLVERYTTYVRESDKKT